MPKSEEARATAMALPLAVIDLCRLTEDMWVQETYPCSKQHSNQVCPRGLANNTAKSDLASLHSVLPKRSNASSLDPQVGADGMQSTSDVLAVGCSMEQNRNGKSQPAGVMKDLVRGSNDGKSGRSKGHGILKVPDTFLNLDPMTSKKKMRVRFDEDSIGNTSTR